MVPFAIDMRHSSVTLACIAILASCSGAFPGGPGNASVDANAGEPTRSVGAMPRGPIALLLEAERFESARVGYAGVPSRRVDAWRQILKSDGAASQFAELFRAARTPAARMYALTGLFAVNRAAFDSVVATRAWPSDSVDVTIGCVGLAVSPDTLVAEIAAGVWDKSFRSGELPQ